MMDVLDSLRLQLKQTNDQAFRGLVFDQNPMRQELGRLQKLVGSAGSAKPMHNRVLEALRRFHQSKSLTSLRETRLVCHGCLERFQDGYRLMDDVESFPLLLHAVHQHRDGARALRHCYRGLLHTYFVYDPEDNQSTDDGKRNWAELRTHLRGWADRLTGEGLVPDWVAALKEHRNVLTDEPCARYGLSTLEGRRQEFEQVQRALAIPDTSWLVRRLIFAQVHAATQLGDADFKPKIRALLALLVEHKTVLRPGLARVLERYKACAAVGLNAELRDFAVSHWGNPWLARNAAAWGLVSEQTRAMVADWLKLEFIQRFFSLLAEDGGSDTRRLKFWERYRAHIDDMYFALGPSTA